MSEQNAFPVFSPRLEFDHNKSSTGEGSYQDGRVSGAIQTYEDGQERLLVIHGWSSRFPAQGHTTVALKWLREQGYDRIAANGIGMINDSVSQASTNYWLHQHSQGLVDVLLDDESYDVTPKPRKLASPR